MIIHAISCIHFNPQYGARVRLRTIPSISVSIQAGTFPADLLAIEKFLIALQPRVTTEKWYPNGQYDFNLVPVVIGHSTSPNWGLRYEIILNYNLATNASNAPNQSGIQPVVPYHCATHQGAMAQGFYAGPQIGMTYSALSSSTALTLGVEDGYSLLFTSAYSLNFGLQLGTTMLNPAPHSSVETSVIHQSMMISFGKWSNLR